MTNDDRRIMLVNRSGSAPERPWLVSRAAPRRLIFVNSFGVIPYAIKRGAEDLGKDIESVVIDGTATAAEYLQLLAVLPAGFAGDVVLIQDDGAFLSASGRGGDRVLYALGPDDLRFYLEAKMLTAAA
jgi:6-phosphogluconolactonase (cycloisomerase 2 family)